MPQRSNIYVDGFNLYYGVLRATPHKWLDLERYFRLLRQADDIQNIHYFTARVRSEPQQTRQSTYIRALTTLPLVNVIEGRFKMKTVQCGVHSCTYSGDRRYKVPEEKRTDVSIALQILRDAYDNAADTFVIVSGDSDLVPVLDILRTDFPRKQTVVYVPGQTPARSYAVELRSAAKKARNLPFALLKHAHLPSQVSDGAGGFLSKPATW